MKTKIFQQRLMECLKEHHDRTAIKYGPRLMTYDEVDKKSSCTACWLLDKEIEKGTFIGILLNDRMETVVQATGIIKAGCVVVPFYPGHPTKRIEAMIQSIGLKYLFVDTENASRFDNSDIPADQELEYIDPADTCLKEEYLNALITGGIEFGPVDYDPNDPLYIHFTSGSTGVPKAVVGKNKSLLQFIEWELAEFAIDSEVRIGQVTIPGFDPFLRDICCAFLSGGVLCIPGKEEILLNPPDFAHWVERQRISLIHCVVGQFRLLSGIPVTADHYKSLNNIIMAGEKISPADVEKWFAIFGDRIHLANCYGTTETTMFKTCHHIQVEDAGRERVPVGKPIKGARVIVMDENMNVCEEMIPGEIYIRSPYMSCGYYENPGANKERFIPNPFSDNPNDLIYKTGDRGRFLPDGNLDFIGRIDRQLKIRGNRIEPGEIESIITRHQAINEAAVIKREVGNNEILIAYIVQDAVHSIDTTELVAEVQGYLEERVPAYMIPTVIQELPRLPRNPHGKVDYKNLPEPKTMEDENMVAPRDQIENGLFTIWSNILGLDDLGVHSNFFKKGGNSLNLMTLTYQIHKEFDVRLALSDIFRNPTIEKQASLIRQGSQGIFESIPAAPEKLYYVLSAAQRRMHIIYRLNPTSTSYNVPMVARLTGQLHMEKVENTFKKLIKRHETLRTAFVVLDGEPMQEIYRPDEIDFSVTYYRKEELPAGEDRQQEADRLVRAFVRPFNLEEAPLMRVGFIELGADEHILIVDMHHIITDGTSLAITRREFMSLYAGEKLLPLKIQYKDFSEWQNSPEQQEKLEQQEKYWLEQFAEKPPVLNLPYDFDRPAMPKQVGKVEVFEISQEEASQLYKILLDQEVTMYMLLLAIYNIFLARLSGLEDIVVGSPTAGRIHADLEPLIGMFINTLPLRNYPSGEKSFKDFLLEVKDCTIGAFENQGYQFEDLVSKLNIEQENRRNPLFDAAFTVQNMGMPNIEIPGLTLGGYEYERGISKFDLSLMAYELDGRLVFTLEYSTELFSAGKIERFIEYFKDIVTAVVADTSNQIKIRDIHVSIDLEDPISDKLGEIEGDFDF